MAKRTSWERRIRARAAKAQQAANGSAPAAQAAASIAAGPAAGSHQMTSTGPRSGPPGTTAADVSTEPVTGLTDEEVDYFQGTLALGRALGKRNLESFVRNAWRARYGTELSSARYRYYAFDRDHEARRKESLNRVFSDPQFLALADPRFLLIQNYQLFTATLRRVLNDGSTRDITGATMMRARVGEEWTDIPVVHRRIADRVYEAALKGLLQTTEAILRMHGLDARGDSDNAGGSRARSQANANVSLSFGKATAFVAGESVDPAEHVFDPQEVKELIEQENRPFRHVPPLSITYEEHLRRVNAYRDGTGPLPYGQKDEIVGDAKTPAEAAREAMRKEMMRGVMLDPEAVKDADEAARRMGAAPWPGGAMR